MYYAYHLQFLLYLKSDTSTKDEYPRDEDSDEETDEHDGHTDEDSESQFDAFLTLVGLNGKFPSRLSLGELCIVKDPCKKSSLHEVFWQKLGSLDYRARTKEFINQICSTSHPISVRDFIFVLLHCSDGFLRQDIIEKMAACQLAVPIILRGVNGGTNVFLNWSLRRVIKKWKEINAPAVEHHIITVPVFTVVFLRLGEIKEFSKSRLLNHFLGSFQGHREFSYFVSNKNDFKRSKFSDGCVEGVWYLPSNSNGANELKSITCLLNLRGDATQFAETLDFCCRSANLTFIFFAKRNREDVLPNIKKSESLSNRCHVISIDDEAETPRLRKNIKNDKNWLFVRYFDMETVCEAVCEAIFEEIKDQQGKCKTKQLTSLENLAMHCAEGIEVEDEHNKLRKARNAVETVCESEALRDLVQFKEKSFPLQAIWLKWVKIDKEQIHPEGETSAECLLEDAKNRKEAERLQQIKCGLSPTMQKFMEIVADSKNDMEYFAYFLSFLQERLREAEEENIKENIAMISELNKKIVKLDSLIQIKLADLANNSVNETEDDSCEEQKRDRQVYEEERQREARLIRNKCIGWQHFIREFGQLFEAHTESYNAMNDRDTFLLPGVAAKFLIDGHSVEIMDGDTGRVPLSWVSKVLSELVVELGDPPILVLSTLGVQSSGKSTLLNTMFGVRFPVRSGQCTRGLYLRILQVEDKYYEEIGIKYIFLIDSEGIRSQERLFTNDVRFDNELVTLVLCISDITLLNISGENVGPEMTGLMQIAAHALLRMKKVRLHSQCRITQQRVSDITADERNRVTMTQIEASLNEAVKEASEKEGFGNRYEQFSDVFDLRLGENGENLQFFPPLWSGLMSPPNELYGHRVTKVKESILQDVKNKKVRPQFRVSEFRQRIRDVWMSVKSENFLFNFQDSIKAIDFDNACMEFNKWIKDMDLEFLQELAVWQGKLLNASHQGDKVMDEISGELQKKVEEKRANVTHLLELYISNHVRPSNIEKHKKWLSNQLDEALKEAECHSLTFLNNNKIVHKMNTDLQTSVAKARKNIRNNAKTTAENLRVEHNFNLPINENGLRAVFDGNWEKWVQNEQTDFSFPSLSEKTLETTCEKTLLSITTEMAVSSELTSLIKDEGSIRRHSDYPDWKKYYPEKHVNAQVKETWIRDNEQTLRDIINESYAELTKKGEINKMFDATVIHFILRDALQKLSPSRFSSEPPFRIKAKVMLHIAYKLFTKSLENHRIYETENSFQKLMDREKETLFKDFIAFIRCENLVFRVIDFFRREIPQTGQLLVKIIILKNIQERCLKAAGDNRSIHKKVLCNFFQKNNFINYIAFSEQYFQVVCSEIWNVILNIAFQQKDNILDIHHHAKAGTQLVIDIVSKSARAAVKQVKEHFDRYSFRDWVEHFVAILRANGFNINSEATNELRQYDVQDIGYFMTEFEKLVNVELRQHVLVMSRVPEKPHPMQMENFLNEIHILDNIITTMTRNMCFEQCPFCGAPCSNSLPMGRGHGSHFALTHLPLGISGKVNPHNNRLDINDCQTLVYSSRATYMLNGRKKLYKDYKIDFPNWSIEKRGELMPEHSKVWRWVMATYNKQFAEYYRRESAKIPHGWTKIRKEDALACLS